MKPKQPHGPPMTLGNMRELGVRRLLAICLNDTCLHQVLIAAAFLLGLANSARAEIIYFSCPGTLETSYNKSRRIEREHWTAPLTFDSDKKTVKFADQDPVPVEVSDDSLDMPPMAGVRRYDYGTFGFISLTLNRITGQLETHRIILPDGTETFSAICKRTSKLF
jgi:hypothetical protein